MLQIQIKNENQDSIVDIDKSIHAGRVEFDHDDSVFVLITDPYVSRKQFILSKNSDSILLKNIGSSEIVLGNREQLEQGDEQEIRITDSFSIGQTKFRFVSAIELPHQNSQRTLQTISSPIFLQGSISGQDHPIQIEDFSDGHDNAQLITCLEAVLTVQQSSTGSQSFYQETADAVVHAIGLDYGMVLLKVNNKLETAAICDITQTGNLRPSQTVINRVLEEKRTYYELDDDTMAAASLAAVTAVVASPIFDADGDVIGIVYGARLQSSSKGAGVSKVEAQITQLLACSVSSGLARVERDAEMARLKVQFEEFVSPELSRELERDPSLLDGRERTVTCLFADLRRFSAISEVLGAQGIYDLMQDVMDTLTACVISRNGVIINYAGDGMAAMWNAPIDQMNHAELACSAAIEMQNKLPELNKKWQDRTGMPLRVGIGINTGPALVGNAGSSLRIKYGPMGNAVNLASRVEGTTKFFGIPILVTENTHSLLSSEFQTRRICAVRVVGIQEPATLYQLRSSEASGTWLEGRSTYENALSAFHQEDFDTCTKLIENVMQNPDFSNDRPSNLLSKWSLEAQTDSDKSFDPVRTLDQK